MKMYALTMRENDIVMHSPYGAMFTPDVIFDGPSLQFVPNRDRKMLVGIEVSKGVYRVELCTIGDALTIKSLPDGIDCITLDN